MLKNVLAKITGCGWNDELATVMECRCYHGGEGQAKLHLLKYQRRDHIALALGALICADVIVLRQFGL